jgi:hypothetical protein
MGYDNARFIDLGNDTEYCAGLEPDDDRVTFEDERRRVADIIRNLRHQVANSVTSELLAEWRRKANIYQLWRRDERAAQRS